MKQIWKRILPAAAAGVLLIAVMAAAEEAAPAADSGEGSAAQQEGYAEIESLLENSEVPQTEDMTLEEITDAFNNGSMKEFLNVESGLSVQYPAMFEFQDDAGYLAVARDGQATLEITSVQNQGAKLLKNILEITGDGMKDAKTEYNPDTGTLLLRRVNPEEKTVYADLYLETKSWLHHAALVYPESQENLYDPYLLYMLHSMTSNESAQG